MAQEQTHTEPELRARLKEHLRAAHGKARRTVPAVIDQRLPAAAGG